VRGSASKLDGDLHGFPRVLTSFVGRAREISEVGALLDEYRMVTVTGPGGVGKTRLAAEAARELVAGFADGGWLVELAAVQDPAQVADAVAVALSVPRNPDLPITETLVAALARRQILVLLDNCEHVLDAVAELCQALLSAADDVRILATSREATGLAGEARYRLDPLAVPDLGGPAEAGHAPAVALFADRARQADSRFVLDGGTAPAVARLVARLDGMPLAIELAAARVEALGLDQLVSRLETGFALLTGRNRASPARHRSLAATMEWSHGLLTDTQRQVFRRLAVFPGPFTLDAVAAVAGEGAEPALLQLVDCSLVTPPRTGIDGRARYVILETLRSFAWEQLTGAGEHDITCASLSGYLLQVAEQAADGRATSRGELAAGLWLDAESAALRQVVAWTLENDPATALRLVTALAPWWHLRGRSAEAYALLTAATERTEADSAHWPAAQCQLGQAAAFTGATAAAVDHFTAACAALSARPPSTQLCDALFGRAFALMNVGRSAEGIEDARRALAVARELGYSAGEAGALICLTHAAFLVDDYQQGVKLARQACRIDPGSIPGELAREAAVKLTMTLTASGDIAGGRQSCLDTLALARESGDKSAEVSSLILIADLDRRAGQPPDSWPHLRDATSLALGMQDWIALHDCLSLGGDLCALAGRWAETVTLWAADGRFMTEAGLVPTTRTSSLREAPLREAARALGPEGLRAAQERGAAMIMETAGEFLLVLTATSLQAPAEPSSALSGLSAREQELVALVAKGQTDAQIARQLFISVSTVRSHLDRIRDKTNCRRRADLTRLALRSGLV
jgi:predicted ATPase/DNA-binding CsgD family transcriptional regulator